MVLHLLMVEVSGQNLQAVPSIPIISVLKCFQTYILNRIYAADQGFKPITEDEVSSRVNRIKIVETCGRTGGEQNI